MLSYLEGEFSPGSHERVDAHLRACPACRARLERLIQTIADLNTTLQAVGEQVPLSPASSWDVVAQRWRRKRPRRFVLPFRPLLRYAVMLIVLAFIVGGLAGLLHTLAVTGPAPAQPTPPSTPTLPAGPSPAPGPLPRPHPDPLAVPVSLLILGIDGESATSDETDALMLLYLDGEAERAFLISIPRALYVRVPGYGQARAGRVYGLGQQDGSGGGLTLARETISTTLGLPVQHAALLRFDSFVTFIDVIGGVDIVVPHPIEDPNFPDGRGGFDPFSISAGSHHLDGATALRYARTRATPDDDFDRAFRQQQLVLAVHDQVTRLDLLPDLIAQAPTLWSAIAVGLDTDLSLNNVIDLAFPATSITTNDITTVALDECCTVQYTASTGEQVLLPQPDEIEVLIETLLEGNQ